MPETASKRRVVEPFTLITGTSERKYQVDEVIEGEVAEHWYAQHHSEPVKEPTRKKP